VVTRRFWRCSGSRESIHALVRHSVCGSSAPSLRVNPMPPRITQKSHRPRASHRMMVGTEANGWLAQLRNEWCRNRGMKPRKEDQPLRSVSRSYSVALQALKPKSSPRRRRGLDASTDRGLTERSGEVFSLDILSHRTSVTAIFHQLSRSKLEARTNVFSTVFDLEAGGLPRERPFPCPCE
jgi:hypothetical protein